MQRMLDSIIDEVATLTTITITEMIKGRSETDTMTEGLSTIEAEATNSDGMIIEMEEDMKAMAESDRDAMQTI